MPSPRSPSRDRAKQLWLESGKKRLLKDIAEELQVSEEQGQRERGICRNVQCHGK